MDKSVHDFLHHAHLVILLDSFYTHHLVPLTVRKKLRTNKLSHPSWTLNNLRHTFGTFTNCL